MPAELVRSYFFLQNSTAVLRCGDVRKQAEEGATGAPVFRVCPSRPKS